MPMKIEMNMAVVDTMSKTKVVNKTWRKRAEDEAKHFLDKVAAIRASIMEGKNAGNQYKYSGQWVVGKLAKFEAAIADRKYFACNEKLLGALSEAERSIVAQAFSLIEQPCFNLESSMQNRRIQAKKLSGIFVESVICNDRFGVPKAALTCNALLDDVNWLLADGYSAITCLLERICLYMVFKVLFEDLCDRMDAEINDLIAATGVLRTLCRKVRAVVIELGGPPLLEPVAFWKEKYPMVKF